MIRIGITKWWSNRSLVLIKIDTEEQFLVFKIAATLLGYNWNSSVSYFTNDEEIFGHKAVFPVYLSSDRTFKTWHDGAYYKYDEIIWDIIEKIKGYNWITQIGGTWYITEQEPRKAIKRRYSKVPKNSKIKATKSWSPPVKDFKPIKITFPKSGN